jgi:hypothetical protein
VISGTPFRGLWAVCAGGGVRVRVVDQPSDGKHGRWCVRLCVPGREQHLARFTSVRAAREYADVLRSLLQGLDPR